MSQPPTPVAEGGQAASPADPTVAAPPASTPPAAEKGKAQHLGLVAGVIALILLAGIVVVGMVLVAHHDQTTGTGSRSVAEASPSMSPTPTDVGNAAGTDHSGDLRRLLLKMPADARAWQQDGITDETMTLDQVASTRSKPEAMAGQLRRYDFSDGAARCWARRDARDVCVQLLRFKSALRASQFLQFFNSGVADINADRGGRFADVPGGAWFVNPEADKYGKVYSETSGQRGDIVIFAFCWEPAPKESVVQIVQETTKQQYDLL